MPILVPEEIASLEEVPEGYRDLYEREGDEGPFSLKDREGFKTDEDLANVRGALKRERELKQKAEGRALSDDDREEYEQLKTERREREGKKLIDEGKVDELVETRTREAIKDKDKVIGEKDTQLTSMTQSLEKLTVDAALTSAVAELGEGFKADVGDVLNYGKYGDAEGRKWKRNPETDVAVLVDQNDEVVLGKDGKTPIKAGEWLEGLRSVKRHWFGESKGAGGSHQDDKSGGAPTNLKRSEMNHKQKAEFIEEHGGEAYEALPFK